MQAEHNYIRSFFVLILFLSIYIVIALNLYFIQIYQQHFFKELGAKQHNITIKQHPDRALIFDKHNQPIAINKESFSAFILPKELRNKDQLILFLQHYFPQAHQKLESYLKKNFMFIKRHLSEEELSKIKKMEIQDIHLLQESSRYYPYNTLGPIIGTTDIDNNGLFGLEKQYNDQLQGTPTQYSLKKDARAHHFYFAKETKQQGIPGKDLHLTIDATLQFKFQQIINQSIQQFGATEAGALALDPDTGEISAMVSYPIFDPNNIKTLDIETTKNRPASQAFETGSVIKVFAALAALEEKVTSLDEPIDCENKLETKIDNIRIRTVVAHGVLPFSEVIEKSNNIGVVKVMKRLGYKLYDYYTLLGLGAVSGSNIQGEQKGFVNPPEKWSAYSIQSLSYGYEITTTILQLARALALIFNDGYLISPHIIKTSNFQKHGPLISQQTINEMQTVLQRSVEQGTGKRAKIKGYDVFGKTGTSNILINGAYDESKHLYTFIGCVKKENYKRIIVTYIKDSTQATYSSVVAAPLFRKLAEAIILHDQVL